MITTINEFKHIFESLTHSDYLKWKRKNVTYRGMTDTTKENGGSAMLGKGLYTAALSNKALAKQYGDVYFVINAIPKNPKIFNSINEWEIWFYNTLVKNFSDSKYPDRRKFYEQTTIENEMIKLGYDGIIIKGRELVNYKPENVQFFKNEIALQDYFYNILH